MAQKKVHPEYECTYYMDLLWALWISLDGVDEMHQLTLDIIRFVFMPDVSLRKAINHADHFWQESLRFRSIGHSTQFFHCRTGRFAIIALLNVTL